MVNKLKKFGIIFATFLMVLGTMSFVGVNNVKAADTETGTDTVTIGTLKNTASLPAIMGGVNGTFNHNNVSVDVKTYGSNNELKEAIANGSVNAAVTNLVTYASLVKDNSSWKIAGTLPGYYGLVSNKKYKKVKKLKGKTIALDKKDSSKQYLKSVLKKNKIKYSKVTIKQIDSDTDRVAALKSGEVDAAVLEDPSISNAKGNGGKILNRQKTSADNGNVFIINNDFAKKNASSTKALIYTMDQGIKLINKSGGYGMAGSALRQMDYNEKGAKYLTEMDIKFKKIHKVKKSDFKKAFKYAKSQKLFKGKISYNKYNLKIKGVK